MLVILIFGSAVTAFASSFQELAAKWFKAYSYMPPLVAYGLLSLHTLLTPGLALLGYGVLLLKQGERRSRFFQGSAFLIYVPFRLGLIFVLLGFFPLWLIFELVELAWLGYAGKRLVEKGRDRDVQMSADG
ncbi:hypothetical protein [Paracidovorax avenae]|uniref:hypothetical protein n=1 Tax=Paracidovorax avenae TaxID=80867 RepID=UPI001AD83072|nr:hypothetical protein [Paracidovorax avenae]